MVQTRVTKDTAYSTAKSPSPPPIGGGLGGPQVMLAVILKANNFTATAKFTEGLGEAPLLPKNGLF